MKLYQTSTGYIITFLFVVSFVGCSKSPPSEGNGGSGNGSGNGNTSHSLEVNVSAIRFPATDSSYSITISSNVNWSVSDNQNWISTSVAAGSNNGGFTVTVTPNTAVSVRNGVVTVSGGGLTRTISVSQGGNLNNDGVTLMRGTNATSLYYDFSSQGELDAYLSQGSGTSVRLIFDSNALVRTKLVNAELGTMTATPVVNNFGYTRYEINFTNTNNYSNSTQEGNPDTAGKLQIWIYREDGQNIMPASGGHPAVKRIIQVPGRFPTMPASVGLIRLLDYDFAGYPVHPPSMTVSSLQNIFTTARWTISINQFTWPW